MGLFGHDTFYHGLMKKYIGYFGTIFNDIEIKRPTSSGEQIMRIPILYGPRDKMQARYEADPTINRLAALATPRIAYELKGMSYNGERKLPVLGMRVAKNTLDLDTAYRNYTPVPYDLDFELNILSKNVEDSMRIVEQILPNFTPEFTSRILLIPETGVYEDVPITLVSTTWQDNYEGDMTERRSVVWTLQFSMKAYFYGPTATPKLIKYANTNFLVGNTTTANTPVESMQVKPGLDANGAATTNNSITIDAANIAIDDPYGYIVTTSYTANGSN